MMAVEPDVIEAREMVGSDRLGGLVQRRFPDFLGIGAQKAATTWLFANLRHHPEIWLPPVKELQYFNDLYIPAHRRWTAKHRRSHGSRILREYLAHVANETWDYRFIARVADIAGGEVGDDWYGNIFTLAGADQVCGEITPGYALLPMAGIEHILRLAPNVKIVYSLRDPIERNWSHIRMIARAEGRTDLLRIATYPDLEGHANYPAVLERWHAAVPAARVLVVFADDIVEHPEYVIETVCDYLKIDFSKKYFPKLRTPVHVGDPAEIPEDLYDLLRVRLRPIYDRMLQIYPDIGRRWIARHY
jgi:hypothetical protein